jgi:phage terminase large subunit
MAKRAALPAVSEDPIGPGGLCGWCERPYVWASGAWWCLTERCQALQASYAVSVLDEKTGEVRWLYVPTSKGVDYEVSGAKNRMLGGAAGGAKSHVLRWGMLRRAMTIQGYNGLLVRRTYGELEKSQLRRLAVEVPMLGGVYHESKYLAEFPQTGALIEAGHLDDAASLSRWLSTEYDEIVADEGSTFNPKFLLELSTRARSSKPSVKAAGGARFAVGTNPGGPAWPILRELFVDHAPDFEQFPALAKHYSPEKWAYIKALLDDNPYRDADYEESLAVLGEARYRQLRWGDEDVFEGQFFSEWREHKDGEPYHVQRLEVPPGTEGFCSLDWGFNDPFVCYWWVCLPDGRYYIRREWKADHLYAEDFAKEWWRITREEVGWRRARYLVVGGDTKTHHGIRSPHGETVQETMRSFGLPVRDADRDRKNGWYRVHELLRPSAVPNSPWLIVDPSCTYLRRTLPNAPCDPEDLDEIDEKTFKQVHGLESVRYGAMSRPSPTRIHRDDRPGPGTWGFETAWQESIAQRSEIA